MLVYTLSCKLEELQGAAALGMGGWVGRQEGSVLLCLFKGARWEAGW